MCTINGLCGRLLLPVSLQDVRVPATNVLPKSDGLKSPLMCLNQARYGISWGAIGAAMSCYDVALQYAKQRRQFKAPCTDGKRQWPCVDGPCRMAQAVSRAAWVDSLKEWSR